MAIVDAIIAGTEVIPMYGASLLSKEVLDDLAAQLLANRIPMHLEHDLDQPMEAVMLAAEVRPIGVNDYQLHVSFEVPDSEAQRLAGRMGMSIAFSTPLIEPVDVEPDVRLFVDPNHFSRAELVLAHQRLFLAGFRPTAGLYYQLSQLPPATVVVEFLEQFPAELAWAVVTTGIFRAISLFLDRGTPTRFHFVRRRGDEVIVGEIETRSREALRDAIAAFKELSDDGVYVREIKKKKWRKAGSGKRRRRSGK